TSRAKRGHRGCFEMGRLRLNNTGSRPSPTRRWTAYSPKSCRKWAAGWLLFLGREKDLVLEVGRLRDISRERRPPAHSENRKDSHGTLCGLPRGDGALVAPDTCPVGTCRPHHSADDLRAVGHDVGRGVGPRAPL